MERNAQGQIKYVDPETKLVSWVSESVYQHMTASITKEVKTGYTKEPFSREHKRRLSISQRTAYAWNYYDELYVYWNKKGQPKAWEFGTMVKKDFAHIPEIRTFRFANMVRQFIQDYDLKMSNLFNEPLPTPVKYVEKVVVAEEDDYEDPYKYSSWSDLYDY